MALPYEKMYAMDRGYAIVMNNEKYGVVDTGGNLVVPLEYDDVELVEVPYFKVKKAGKYGISDARGKLILPVIYDQIMKAAGADYWVCKNESGFQFADKNGAVFQGAIYDDCDILTNGYAFVKRNNKYGMVDLSGKMVVPVSYDSVSILNHKNATMVAVARSGKWGLININNEQILPCIYERKIEFGSKNVAWLDSGEYTAAVNEKGRFIVPFGDYTRMVALSNGMIVVYEYDKSTIGKISLTLYNNEGVRGEFLPFTIYGGKGLSNDFEIKEHSKGFYIKGLNQVYLGSSVYSSYYVYFFNQKGVKINMTSTEGIYGYDSADRTGYFWSVDGYGTKYYLMDTLGRSLVKDAFTGAGSYNNGFSLVNSKGLGIVGAKGLVIPTAYDHIFRISENAFAVNKGGEMNREQEVIGGKWGVFNLQGKMIVPVLYRELYLLNDNAFLVGTGSSYGVVNMNGRLFIDTLYKVIRHVSGSPDIYAVNKGGVFDPNAGIVGGKWGFVDATGKLVYPVTGDRVTAFESGRAWVFTADKWFMIKTDGTRVPGESYAGIGNSGNGLTPVMKKDKWGFIDVNNNMIIKPVFKNTGSFSNGICVVQDAANDKLGAINTRGEYVIQPEYDELLAVRDGYLKFSKNGALFIFDKTGKAMSTFLTK